MFLKKSSWRQKSFFKNSIGQTAIWAALRPRKKKEGVSSTIQSDSWPKRARIPKSPFRRRRKSGTAPAEVDNRESQKEG
jgi:hypothetical protein